MSTRGANGIGATFRKARRARVLGLLATGRRDLAKNRNLLPSVCPTGATRPEDDRFCGLMFMTITSNNYPSHHLYTLDWGLTWRLTITACFKLRQSSSTANLPLSNRYHERHSASSCIRVPSAETIARASDSTRSPANRHLVHRKLFRRFSPLRVMSIN